MINKTQFKPFDIVYHDEIFEYNYHFLCDTPDPDIVWVLVDFIFYHSTYITIYSLSNETEIII